MKLFGLAGAALAAATYVAGLQPALKIEPGQEAWRKQRPRPEPSRPLSLPRPRRFSLANGITVVLVEDHRTPTVTIEAAMPFDAGSSTDLISLTNQVTLAEATGELLTAGAGARTSRELAREVESMGGRMSSAFADDYVEVSAEVISENAERILEFVADVLIRPTFPQSEISLFKNTRLDKLASDRQDPGFLADERFAREVFGRSTYAISSPTRRSVAAINRATVTSFYRRNVGPEGSVFVITGDFRPDRIEAKARELLGSWAAANRSRAAAPVQARSLTSKPRRVLLIDRPGSQQADFRIGGQAVARNHPDYVKLLVTNAILGDGTSSRLFLNLRERLGYAYDVASYLEALKRSGAFYGGSQTRTEVAAAAIREMLAEFDRIRTGTVSDEELTSAKNYLNGLFSLSLASQEGIAARLRQAHIYGLGSDYLENYRSRIDSVTASQVQETARKYCGPDNAVIVVVGDAAKLRSSLASLGRVEVFSSSGRRKS
jgi:predicted Zn-dependent peptidase